MADSNRGPSQSNIPAQNVRRNLFSSHASHRNTSAVRTATVTTNLADGAIDANNSEIVVRNSDGGYQFSVTPPPPTESTPTAEQEAEQKLAEMLSNRSRQSSEVGMYPHRPAARTVLTVTELLNAIKASLRRKVASVQDDKWMFESEGRP